MREMGGLSPLSLMPGLHGLQYQTTHAFRCAIGPRRTAVFIGYAYRKHLIMHGLKAQKLCAVALSGRAGVHSWLQNRAEKYHGF